MQNSPKELMSLLCFLMPLFDSKTKSSKRKRGYDGDDNQYNDGGERMLEYFVNRSTTKVRILTMALSNPLQAHVSSYLCLFT